MALSIFSLEGRTAIVTGAGGIRGIGRGTALAFAEAGAWLYNEAVLITSIGTLPIRIGRQFVGSRKLGKCHQNVLVFFNGDPQRIKVDFKEAE